MKNTPKITELMKERESVKTISTVSNDGKLHTIVAGSITPIDADTIAVAEIFMNVSAENLGQNAKAAFLVTKGTESYLLNCTATKRHTDGALYDGFAEKLAAAKMSPKAVWTFSVDEIYDQSAAPTAGTKLF